MRLPACSDYLSYSCCILLACLLLNYRYSDAKRRREEQDEEKERPDARTSSIPYQSCGTHRICDRRTQYCDEVVGDCVECADDCHPARIREDAAATSECSVLCQLYYQQMIANTGSHGHGIDAVADDDDDDDDDDDGADDDVVARTTHDDDDADTSCVGPLSRRELRLLIELELLKLQSRTAMEIMFCAMILSLLVIGFIWLRSFGHPKTGALAKDATGM